MMSRRLPIALLLLCGFSQLAAAADLPPPTDAQKSFELIKSLAGDWRGPITVDNPAWATDKPANITMRVVSRGNALAHEYKQENFPAELTVFYVDHDQLNWSIIAIMRIGRAWLPGPQRTEKAWSSNSWSFPAATTSDM